MAQINFNFIKGNEGRKTTAYVPTNKQDGSVIGQSGVTIATGFDLGQQDISSISQLSKPLQEKLIPYLGVKKDAAVKKLNETGGLKLSDEEVNEIDMMAKEQYSSRVKQSYNKLTGKNFDELPSNLQTVIADVQFQYGTNYSRTPKFAGIIKEISDNPSNIDAYMKLENELRNFGDDYGPRRKREADLIKEQISTMQGMSTEENIMSDNEAMLIQAKRNASKVAATSFNILNVMQDLGQVFEPFEKEGK